MRDSVRDRLNASLERATKTEKAIASFMLANLNGLPFETAATLAQKIGVSEPSVGRFCRAIGYEGWHDFKLKLAQSLALALPGADETLAQDDLAADLRSATAPRPVVDAQADLRQQSERTVRQTVQACAGNLSEAARRLGISRNTLYRKLDELGLR